MSPAARPATAAAPPALAMRGISKSFNGILSIAEQQIVEIAKALCVEARVLVMDEPTTALDDREAARLLGLVRGLAARGVAVIYVSHREATAPIVIHASAGAGKTVAADSVLETFAVLAGDGS